jgi:dihydrolipoamide dehydrogenase
MDYDLIVIGSGPGGYVAAIRASQLNLKTAIVERESLGGICLNWGCIPTKALLKSANVFEYIKYSQDYGIIVSESKINFDVIIKRSRDVANGMSRGVQFLMKKNKIDVIMGTARVKPGKKIEVTDESGKVTGMTAKNIMIATGSRSKNLPALSQDGKLIIGYREAMVLPKLIFDEKYGEFLGAHMIGSNVTEMIAECVAARKLETTGHELIKTVHPHPTMSEAIMEAAAAAYGEVIHL